MRQFMLIILFFTSIIAKGQFLLTPEGFVNEKDSTLKYVVILVDNLGQKELFNSVLLYINSIFVSPKDVISTIDSTSITINGVAPNSIRRNTFHVFDLNYTITFLFRPGRIKVNSPSFRLTTITNGRLQTLYLVANDSFDGSTLGIWTKKGILGSKMAKSELEVFFNTFINKLMESITKEEEW